MNAVLDDFMFHLLPKNNWSELSVLSSISKAFVKPLVRDLGLE